MKYFLIAGERSGDLHGSFLIRELFSKDPQADVYFWGGDYMERAGGKLLRHYKDTAVMGFWEVLKSLKKLKRLQQLCKAEILQLQPDAIIFIDFPGFNLRIADFTKEKGFLNFYYISPKVWAWNQKRALKLKKRIDRIFCILPFEPAFFEKYDMEVSYVGNPLKEVIKSYALDKAFLSKYEGKKVVGVLPGSRMQEVSNVLGLIKHIAPTRAGYHFLLAGVDNLPPELYADVKTFGGNIEIAFDKTYEILRLSEAAIVTSGTATLEAALLRAPQVVVYKTSNFSYQIARRLIRVPFISLVNLIAGKEVVKELIQQDMTPQKVLEEVDRIILDAPYKETILSGYAAINELIGDQNAPEAAAREMVDLMHLKRNRQN